YARLNNNVHWASDVVGGALIGITIGQVVVHFNMKLRSKK
ncbi:MAG: phosphatase PAP2 family protein, partial [Candidatus Zixiibacteriota bacterium]